MKSVRKSIAVAALAVFGFGFVPGIDGLTGIGPVQAKQSNGNAGGNGNNGNGAGNGNGGAQPGTNIAPVADAGRDMPAQAGQTVTLDGSGSFDGDGDPVAFRWELIAIPSGSAAQLDDATAVKPGFTVDIPGEYEVRLVVDDGLVASAPDQVIVTTGDIAPTADAGADIPAATGGTVALNGAGSADANGDAITYNWRIVEAPAGSGAAPADENAAQTSFFADTPGDYVAELTVSDSMGAGEPDRVAISTQNVAPAADAGADLVFEQTGEIALEAELSADANGDELSFRWTVLNAPENARYQIRNSTERRAFLLFDDAGDYVVQLTVADAWGGEGIDTALITGGNARPIADAGPDRAVAVGNAVSLDASGSTDANGDLLTARWALVSKPDGSLASIGGAGAVLTGFTADIEGVYVAQLIVDDGAETSAPDTVVITTGNVAPMADAGPDLWVGPKDGAVSLDGGASSDDNDDSLNYRWSLLQAPQGSAATLANSGSANASFTPDRAGTYLAQLIVNDGTTDSAPSVVVIAKAYGNLEIGPGSDQGDGNGDKAAGVGHDTNLRPVAVAGPDQKVPGGATIQLDGSASFDPNGHDITHEWALIFRPAGSEAAIGDPAAPNPVFTTDVSGVYVAQLTVRDSQIESFPDTVLIFANTPPVADAGPDQEVVLGNTVTLDGTGSFDADGDMLSYSWKVLGRPAGGSIIIDDADSATASFTPNVFGEYEIQLIVNDGVEDSAPDMAIITIVNTPPVAEAGVEQSVAVGSVVTLDGTGSFDPDGQSLSYSWRFTARPEGSAATFDISTSATPSFTADVEGLYIAELTVNDGVVDSAPDVVGVRAGPLVANRAPVLDAIGPQTVLLGGALRLQLGATDPDGDAVYFFASPMPLPDNMTMDATTGALTFRPDATQVGNFTLTFGASDGALRDSESVFITVNTPPPGNPTSLAGRVLDANASEAGETVPIAGATIRLVESGQTATSDADGNFLIGNTLSGDVRLDISRSGYQSRRFELTMYPNTVNMPDPFHLARLDTGASRVYTFSAARFGLTVHDATTGVTVRFAPGMRRHPILAFVYRGTLTVSSAPYESVAPLVPEWINPCLVMSITASPSSIFRFSATFSMPNSDNLAPGSEVDVWNLNPSTNVFQIVNIGRVNADGSRVEGSIIWPTLFFAAPPAPLVMASADQNATSLSPTLLADGNVSQAISLPGVISLGEDRSQTLVYNSGSAHPRPIVAMDTTILARTGVPATIDGVLEVGGVTVAGPFMTDTQSPAPLPEDEDATIRHAAQFDAGEMATGSHPFRFTATANYGCSAVSASTMGEVLVNNQSDSPFGAGWTLAGLERLHIGDDGDLLLTEGDGTAKTFDANPRPNFFPPLGFPASVPGAGALDDLDGDGNLDMAVPEMGNGDVAVLLGDGAGNFPADSRFNAGRPHQTFPDINTVATGDFNNDGVRDLLVSAQMSDRVRVYLGNGDGTFQAPRDITRGRPQGLAVADFDGDGNDDFVVGTLRGNTLNAFRTWVYFGDGTGNFPAARIRSFVVPWPTTPVTGDFDNNGSIDVAVASAPQFSGSKIVLALSDGTGEFIATSTSTDSIRNAIGRYPLAAADFNGDGNLDLALTVANADFFTVYFGNGIGGFFRSMRVPTGVGEANSLTAADYDGDGDLDVIASGRNTAAVVLFESGGDGGLMVDETVPLGGPPLLAVRAGDFNNDGAPDLQTGDPENIFVLLADRRAERRFRSPGGDFSQLDRNPDGGFTRRMTDGTVIEYNADGLMVARVDANGNVTEYSYDSGGLLTGISDPADPSRSTTFDYSGDGIASITDLAGRTTFFQIDGDGNLISFADAESNLSRYAYDGESRLTAFASARGFVTTVDYGFAGQYLGNNNPDGTSITAEITGSLGLVDPGLANGEWIAPEDRIAKFQDAKGNPYEFEVNEYGHTIRTTDPLGRTTIIARDENNLVTRTIAPTDNDPSGTVVTEINYDDNGNVVAKREATGTELERETRFEYDPVFNRTTKVTDPAGGETTLVYDDRGNLLTITDAAGSMQRFEYDLRGLRASATDQNGNITTFTYDFFGNIQTSTNGAGDVTRMVRDAAGEAVSVTGGYGTVEARTTSTVFDELGSMIFMTDPDGGVTEVRYDADGGVTSLIDATGVAISFTYDEMGRIKTESHPAAGTVTNIYDENSNKTSIIDAMGQTAHFAYDVADRAYRTQDPTGGIRWIAWNSQDKPKQITDANGNATTFTYDALGRQTERRNALGETWTFVWDSRDNITETIDAKEQTVRRTFDELSRPTHVILVETDGVTKADTITFNYDAAGLRTGASDNDSSLAWSYGGAGRMVTAETVVSARTVQPAVVLTQAYDSVGYRKSLAHGPNATSVNGTWYFGYNGIGVLTRVTTPESGHIDLSYDAASRLAGIVSANTVEMRSLLDASSGQLRSKIHERGAAPLARFDFEFDVDGRITTIADSGGMRAYSYDALRQLTGGGYASAPESYSYDAEGNRTASHLSSGYTHDEANRLIEDDDACYSYDANGNLERRTAKVGVTGCIGDETTYEWDVLNRLVRIDFADGTYAAYRYDALGRRIQKDIAGSITRYVYDGAAILLEYDGENMLQARYSHGEVIDQPLSMMRGGQSYFYHTDHLGSVRLLTDAAGAVVNRYDYDVFGNWEGTSYETVTNPYGFTARERDAESGLMFYRARYYDPKIGRFISEDPIGFAALDLNVYRYTHNAPLTYADPLGLQAAVEDSAARSSAGARVGGLGRLGQNLACLLQGVATVVDLVEDVTSPTFLVGKNLKPSSLVERIKCGATKVVFRGLRKKWKTVVCQAIRREPGIGKGILGEQIVEEALGAIFKGAEVVFAQESLGSSTPDFTIGDGEAFVEVKTTSVNENVMPSRAQQRELSRKKKPSYLVRVLCKKK